jgi:cellulose synthase/poly-beta-1,6-N-acetylglucosamine synthase-like glycosyltransferase
MAHIQIAISLFNLADTFFLSVTLAYFFALLVIILGWTRLKGDVSNDAAKSISVCVIVAARNEKENLPNLLSDLVKQSYPVSLTDIIVVDDHSSERVANLDEIKSQSFQNLRIIELPPGIKGKKQAQLSAAELSGAELLLFTDADCRVGPDWIKSFACRYSDTKPALIIGLVDTSASDLPIQKFFHLESLALVVTGAGTASLGCPTLCSGANMAVNRSVYLKMADLLKTEIPSGDDVFLLHAVKNTKKLRIEVNRLAGSIVHTKLPETLAGSINQRARWVSKTHLFSDRDTLILSFLVLITNLVLILSFTLSLVSNRFDIFMAVLILKIMADCLLTGVGLRFFNNFQLILFVPFFDLLYPVYLIYISITGLVKDLSWKDRPVIQSG